MMRKITIGNVFIFLKIINVGSWVEAEVSDDIFLKYFGIEIEWV